MLRSCGASAAPASAALVRAVALEGETAETAVRAALTGHLVFTTLHTNDAVGAIPRLKDIGLTDDQIKQNLLFAGEKVGELRVRMQENLIAARHKLADAEAALKEKSREVARVTDDYVHDHPWKAIGVAAGAGLLVGLLIGRR